MSPRSGPLEGPYPIEDAGPAPGDHSAYAQPTAISEESLAHAHSAAWGMTLTQGANVDLAAPTRASADAGQAEQDSSVPEDVPDGPQASVSGSLRPTDELDLYRIAIDPGTRALQVTLRASSPSTELPGRVWMIDEAGRIVGDWSIPRGTQAVTLSLQALRAPLDRSIVFGISHGDVPSSNTYHYEIGVARQDQVTLPPGGPVGPVVTLPALPGPVVSVAFIGPTGNVTSPLDGSPGSEPVSLPAQGQSLSTGGGEINPARFALGPLPARSAGPTRDRLADEDATPPLDRFQATRVDLALIDILPRGRAANGTLPMDEGVEPVENRGPAILVSLRGSGGFPLLAAASPVGLASGRKPLAALLAGAGDFPALAARAEESGARGLEPGPAAATVAAWHEGGGRARRRSSAVVGLNLAATLIFGLLLPDLVGMLQGIGRRRS